MEWGIGWSLGGFEGSIVGVFEFVILSYLVVGYYRFYGVLV